MKTTLWTLAALIVAGYLLSTCLVPVKESETVVIMQFGKPVRTIREAGLALKLPAPIQTRTVLDKRLQLLGLEPAEFVTRDRRNLVVSSFAVWRIAEPETFLTSVRDFDTARLRLQELLNAGVGAAIGNIPLSDIFSVDNQQQGLPALFTSVTGNSSATALKEFGIEIISVRPNRFGFPKQNLQSIYQRMMSEQERTAKQHRAEGQEAAAKIRAETEREARELLAEAYRESQTTKGKGEAEAAKTYAEAFQADADYYRFSRSLDAYQKIIGDNTTFILSSDAPIFDYLMTPPTAKPPAAPLPEPAP
ncbi:protease modulator HflC [Thiothrix nivea]|uniref:Protein HflC n=1 Tax=Thiothrix nivea (strain ATCC 35100 / DSM 5205 / JP2) TaxID=870187 RepID=A0A656HA63_THINJ|nr:protease modulator HflC [Thiothrix nivea]EIJ33588.1 protease FtsH subunit HflC [Thiothrix nivea DSM 5205]